MGGDGDSFNFFSPTKFYQVTISLLFQGTGESSHAKAMASHHGRGSTYNKISARFFWYSIYNDVVDFMKKCMTCLKQESLTLTTKTELHSIPVPTAVMNQIYVDICNLSEVDGYCCLVVCIDYFSKWSEAKPLKDKKANTVSQFLYELICRHGCFSIQINDQGREFVNSVSAKLHRLTGII